MDTITQLEQQLAKAKAKAVVDQKAELLTAIKEAVGGKCYAFTFKGRSPAFCIGFKRFMNNAKIYGWSEATPSVEITVQSILVETGTYKEANSRMIKREISVQRFTSVYNATTGTGREIGLREFNDAWAIPDTISQVLAKDWAKRIGVTQELESNENVPKLDIPYIEVTPPESNFLRRPFLLEGYLYLVTPESIRFAIEVINESEGRDSRCSHLFEACDSQYLTGKRQVISSLLGKLRDAQIKLKL